jgi:hypothetical protein
MIKSIYGRCKSTDRALRSGPRQRQADGHRLQSRLDCPAAGHQQLLIRLQCVGETEQRPGIGGAGANISEPYSPYIASCGKPMVREPFSRT